MRNLTVRLSMMILVSLCLPGAVARASDNETVLHPPEGYSVSSGANALFFWGFGSLLVGTVDATVPMVVFSADGRFAFAISVLNTNLNAKRILSFRRDSGDLIDQRDVSEILAHSTIAYNEGTNQVAIFGLGADDGTPEILLTKVDSEGRFTDTIAADLPPLPLGSFSITSFLPPSFLSAGKLMVQPFASEGSADSRTSLSVLDAESGMLVGELDLRAAMPGHIGAMATHSQSNRVAVAIHPFNNAEPDVVAVCSISEAGLPRLEMVIRPAVQTLADVKFDPSGHYLFLLSQETRAKVLSVDVTTGDILQSASLGLKVVEPSLGVSELQVNEATKLVGVIGAKAVAFLRFDENGMLGPATKLDNGGRFDFDGSDFEFLPHGFHAIALDFRKDELLLADTGSGMVLESVPIVFGVPASVAPNGTVAVADFLTDAIHLYTFDLHPQIVFAEAKEKKINIFGMRVLQGATVEIDGVPATATLNGLQTVFTVKRMIAKGQTVMVEIVNPDGSRSGRVPVTR